MSDPNPFAELLARARAGDPEISSRKNSASCSSLTSAKSQPTRPRKLASAWASSFLPALRNWSSLPSRARRLSGVAGSLIERGFESARVAQAVRTSVALDQRRMHRKHVGDRQPVALAHFASSR